MKKVDWKFYVERTGLSLSSILSSALDVQTAKVILEKRGLTSPTEEILEALVEKNILKKEADKKAAAAAKIIAAKPTVPRSKQPKKKKAKNVKTNNFAEEPESKPDDKKKDEKYFRRVIPKSKKSS